MLKKCWKFGSFGDNLNPAFREITTIQAVLNYFNTMGQLGVESDMSTTGSCFDAYSRVGVLVKMLVKVGL